MQNNNLLNQMNPDVLFLDAEPAGIAPIERFPKPLPRRQENKPDKRVGSVYLLLEQIIAQADQIGIDMLGAARADTLRCLGIDLRQYLPDAQSVLMTGQAYPAGAFQPAGGKKQIDRGKRSDPDITGIYAVRQLLKHNSQRLAQVIREKAGFTVVTPLRINRNNLVIACGIAKNIKYGRAVTAEFGRNIVWEAIITNIPLAKSIRWVRRDSLRIISGPLPTPMDLTENIRQLAMSEGADLFGIAPADRVTDMLSQREPASLINVPDHVRRPDEYMANAKSFIVLGIRSPCGDADVSGLPQAPKAGPYDASVHPESNFRLSSILLKVANYLSRLEYQVSPSLDLCGTPTRIGAPNASDITNCRFTAMIAGLGEIGLNGLLLSPEIASCQRLIALVTDAPLMANPMQDSQPQG